MSTKQIKGWTQVSEKRWVKGVEKADMPGHLKQQWEQLKAGKRIKVDDKFLDEIEGFFQNNDHPDDALIGRLASINAVGGGYEAWLK